MIKFLKNNIIYNKIMKKYQKIIKISIIINKIKIIYLKQIINKIINNKIMIIIKYKLYKNKNQIQKMK